MKLHPSTSDYRYQSRCVFATLERPCPVQGALLKVWSLSATACRG